MNEAPARLQDGATNLDPSPNVPTPKPASKSPAQRGRMARRKGQTGERELASLLHTVTGVSVKRQVRQHGNDSDLVGIDGWAVECKRHSNPTPSLIAQWWRQTARQAGEAKLLPALFYRGDGMRQWVAVWPADLHTEPPSQLRSDSYDDTVSGRVETWWRLCAGMATKGVA